MPFSWTEARLAHFKKLVESGKTDHHVAVMMEGKYRGHWTVAMVRSQRGRMERAGTIKRGLSGSTSKRKAVKGRWGCIICLPFDNELKPEVFYAMGKQYDHIIKFCRAVRDTEVKLAS